MKYSVQKQIKNGNWVDVMSTDSLTAAQNRRDYMNFTTDHLYRVIKRTGTVIL